MTSNFSYTEYLPFPSLLNDIVCIWHLKSYANVTSVMHCFPDASVEMFFHFGDGYQRTGNGTPCYEQFGDGISGITTKSIKLTSLGYSNILGIRFRPGRARYYLPFPVSDITNQMIPLAEVFGKDYGYLRNSLTHAESISEMADILCKFLLHIKNEEIHEKKYVEHLIDKILLGENISLKCWAKKSGYCQRHVEREFKSTVGSSAKCFEKIIKISRVIKKAVEKKETLSSLAYSFGYADLPHFTNDFKELTGTSPTTFINSPQILHPLTLRRH